jgi:RNA polymerase sigma-70 factor (ECF subfamily)
MLATGTPHIAAVSSEGSALNGLLARVAAGDHAAFRSLYERSAGRLFAVCLRIARDRSLAEEVVQEAYVRVWERAHQFDPARGNALSWMIAVARNHAIDLVRLRARELGSPDEVLADAADPAALSEIETRIELPGVRRCLAALDEKVRRAIILAYRDGLSYEELAAVLNVPVGTAKTWVSRGLARIRDCLDSP